MFFCKNCKNNSNLLTNNLCIKCLIGNEDPMVWLVKNIKQKMLTNVEQKSITRNVKSEYESFTWNTKTGDIIIDYDKGDNVSIGVNVTYNVDNTTKMPQNICLTFKQWTNNGCEYVKEDGPYHINFNEFEAMTLSLLTTNLTNLIKFSKSNKKICSGCKIEFDESKIIGRKFASLFCSPCWEQYKKQNSRKCGICRSPLWDCYC